MRLRVHILKSCLTEHLTPQEIGSSRRGEKWTKLVVCFVVIVVAIGAQPNAAESGDAPTITPAFGCAPLVVRLAGTVHPPTSGVYFARVYWGDGGFYEYSSWFTSDHYDINVPHTYESPGRYVVVRTWSWNFETEPSFVDSSWVITALATSFTIDSEADPESGLETGCPTRFRVTSNDIVANRISEAWVSWGDGAAEPFTWERTDSGYVTPYHNYSEAGIYQATLQQFDRTCLQQAAINIDTACSTPIEKTTWGRVKSLYQ